MLDQAYSTFSIVFIWLVIGGGTIWTSQHFSSGMTQGQRTVTSLGVVFYLSGVCLFVASLLWRGMACSLFLFLSLSSFQTQLLILQ